MTAVGDDGGGEDGSLINTVEDDENAKRDAVKRSWLKVAIFYPF